jgi:acetylglutamate kinase
LQEIIIIKIGGNCIDDSNALHTFLEDFAQIQTAKILIHGGGKIATEFSKKLNIETKQIDGRRVTDQQTLDVVTMVYAGLINKNVVAQLQKYNCNAIGLTGADANTIVAHKRINHEIDYGFVGDVDQVNIDVLQSLLEKKITPVFAPITHDGNGNLLNTNADTIASEMAIAFSKLYKVTFIYCFEKKGLLTNINDENSIISIIRSDEIEQLKQKQIITHGMIPKVDNIVHALENGVEKVILCNSHDVLSILNGNSIFGTTFIL